MKDRKSKHPGRVKLKPVAGQTDTYDMTRADDPDDTGTPFNTRTMLQDSTGRFLRLPYANPLVDDAFRHMVDRIVPIGTIRTSPAQSLGDAWLKCDGSMVTFEHYPQLCSVLRNTGGATIWDTNSFPSSYTTTGISTVSEPVYFDGKWKVALRLYDGTIKILSVDEPGGSWTEEKSISAEFNGVTNIAFGASDNYCVVAFARDYSTQGYKLFVAVREKSNATWVEIAVSEFEYAYGSWNPTFEGMDHCGDRIAFLFRAGTSSDAYVVFSDTPKTSESWAAGANVGEASGLSCANSKWFTHKSITWNGENGYRIMWADNVGNFNFSEENSAQLTQNSISGTGLSRVVYLAGMYCFLSLNTRYSSIKSRIYKSADLETWDSAIIQDSFVYQTGTSADPDETAYACTSETLMAIASVKKIMTTADPDNGFNAVSIPSVNVYGLAVLGMTAVASTATGIAYHDYTYDSRLLPTISLSDDTTTFIKAKNELDVFESQQSGG